METKKTVFEQTRSTSSGSLEHLIEYVRSLLAGYGISEGRQTIDTNIDAEGRIAYKSEIIGDPDGAHLKRCFSDDYYLVYDPYSGSHGSDSLESRRLVDSETGESFDVSIKLEFLTYTDNQISFRFAGAESEVQKFRQAFNLIF
jgi:hypothetical protein